MYCCVYLRGDGLNRVLVVVTGSVCQSQTRRDQWAAHWRLVGVFSGGHEARGTNCCPRGKLCPSSFTHCPPSHRHPPHNENTGSTINNSLTLLLLLLPLLPSPLRLLLWSAAPCFPFINTVFDVGFIILCQPPNTSMCVIVLDSSWWRGYLARLDWYRAKGLLSMCLQPQTLV